MSGQGLTAAGAAGAEIEELQAEVERWKGLADLKDAKGEANRAENNKLRARVAELEAERARHAKEKAEAISVLKKMDRFMAENCALRRQVAAAQGLRAELEDNRRLRADLVEDVAKLRQQLAAR